MKREHPPLALTIAGSDSGGGAGIQADLKTFQAFGVFGTSVITAVTAQNTVGVSHAHPIPDAIVEGQIDSVATDLRPESFKTGMLATRGVVKVVEAAIRSHRLPAYVLDPVMVATSGDRLLDRRAEGAMRDLLLPRAAVVTPNVQEAKVLTGISISSVKEMGAAARALVDLGAGAALVKGGHLDGDVVADLLWDGSAERIWRRPPDANRGHAWNGLHPLGGDRRRPRPRNRSARRGRSGDRLRGPRDRGRSGPRPGPRSAQPLGRDALLRGAGPTRDRLTASR